jgi:hypothetical protein
MNRKSTNTTSIMAKQTFTELFFIFGLVITGMIGWMIYMQVQLGTQPSFALLPVKSIDSLTVLNGPLVAAYNSSSGVLANDGDFLFIAAIVGNQLADGMTSGFLVSFCQLSANFTGDGNTQAIVDMNLPAMSGFSFTQFGFPIQIPVLTLGATTNQVSPGFIMAQPGNVLRCMVTPTSGQPPQAYLTSTFSLPLKN